MKNKKVLDISGVELISLSCGLAISFSQVYEGEDLHKLHLFFQSIATNLAIIEVEGRDRYNRK